MQLLKTEESTLLSVKKQVAELLNSDNQFALNAFEITPKYAVRLAQAADLAKQLENISMLLVGHTDSFGEINSNYELALKRAETVKHWLVVYGVSEQSITTLTQGSLQPYSEQPQTDSVRHSDRRVEAIILDANNNNLHDNKTKALVNWTKIIKSKQE